MRINQLVTQQAIFEEMKAQIVEKPVKTSESSSMPRLFDQHLVRKHLQESLFPSRKDETII